MAFTGEYVCSECGNVTDRDLLVVKKVQYQELGLKPMTLRSRSVAWLCPKCVARDPHWRQEPYSSPGMAAAAPRSNRKVNESTIFQKIRSEEDAAQDFHAN